MKRIYLLGLLGMSCVLAGFTVSVHVEVGVPLSDSKIEIEAGRVSGHEEITRQAMEFTLIALDDVWGERQARSQVEAMLGDHLSNVGHYARGTIGSKASNPILRGNYATDNPGMEYDWALDLKAFYEVPADVDWHTNPHGQTTHFLRNYLVEDGEVATVGTKLQSPRAACEEGRDKIIAATQAGHVHWLEFRRLAQILRSQKIVDPDVNDQMIEARRKAMFMFGSATHILQDSFSPAHSLRDETADANIVDVCYYNPAAAVDGIKEDIKSNPHNHVGAAIDAATYQSPEAIDYNYERAWNDYRAGRVCQHASFDIGDGIWIRTDKQLKRAESKIFTQYNGEKGNWGDLEKAWWDFENGLSQIELIPEWLEPDFDPIKNCASNYLFTNTGKHQCIKHYARLARNATARYLLVIVKTLLIDENNDWATLEANLVNQLFEGNTGLFQRWMGLEATMPNGVLRCDHLSSESGVIDEPHHEPTSAKHQKTQLRQVERNGARSCVPSRNRARYGKDALHLPLCSTVESN